MERNNASDEQEVTKTKWDLQEGNWGKREDDEESTKKRWRLIHAFMMQIIRELNASKWGLRSFEGLEGEERSKVQLFIIPEIEPF